VEQDDLSGIVVGPEHEDLRQERADLLRRKVDDRDDPAADQVTRTVVGRDPGARALDAERAEVDPEPVRGAPGFGELPRASVTTPMRMSTFSKSGNRSAVRMPGAPGGWPES